ncbi:hypothetical protein MCAG_05384 [Micromonospora sp. ATCC 39149]|nr:hypothetical protein MCAG_05384 [Micromonospora sp. ATCC 39149]
MPCGRRRWAGAGEATGRATCWLVPGGLVGCGVIVGGVAAAPGVVVRGMVAKGMLDRFHVCDMRVPLARMPHVAGMESR